MGAIVDCPKCGAENPRKSPVCRACGERLPKSKSRTRRSTRTRAAPASGSERANPPSEVPEKAKDVGPNADGEESEGTDPGDSPSPRIAREDIPDLLREILRSIRARRYDEAITTADHILQDWPMEPKALVVKADALFRAGRHTDAGSVFDLLIAHDSGNAKLWLDRARVHMAMRAYPEALLSYNKAVEIDDRQADAWYERGLALEALGNLSEALASVSRALEVRAGHAGAQSKREELQDRISKERLPATAEDVDSQIAELEAVVAESNQSDDDLPADDPRQTARGSGVPPEPDEPSGTKRTVPRLRTYVEGFDDSLQGGIPEGAVVVVAGPPGTMKSSLCLTIATWNAIQDEHRTLFVSLEGSEEGLEAQANSLGLPLEKARAHVRVFDASAIHGALEDSGREWIDAFTGFLEAVQTEWPYSILILDSLEAIESVAGFPDRRRGIFRLFERMRELGVTTFVIAGRPDVVVRGNIIYGRWVEDFLADGVILLRQHLVSDVEVQRRIRCVKMRGTRHETGYLALLVDEGRMRATRALAG